MISVPLPQIKEKILENTNMTVEELDEKIKARMEELSGLISEEGAAHIIANEMGIKLFQTSGKLQIKNILPGMRDVEITGKVARKFDVREFNTGERSGKVASVVIADSTGVIRVTFWNSKADLVDSLKEEDVLQINNAYARNNNGKSEVHLNDNSEIKINPEGVSVDAVAAYQNVEKKLADLAETDDNVSVLATIVQVFEPKFFEVCPGCSKRIRDNDNSGSFACETHGTVNDPDYGYVMNLFLDDGTDNVRTVLWRRQVQNLLGMKDEEVANFKDNPVEFDKVKNDLLGNIVRITGRVKKNEAFDRLEFVANFVEKNPNPEEEIQKLKETANEVVQESSGTENTSETQPKENTASEAKAEMEDLRPATELKAEMDNEVKAQANLKKEVKETAETTVPSEANEKFDDSDFEIGELDDDDIPSVDDL